MLGERRLEQQLAEIEQMIERMDLRRDKGFITDKNEYLDKRAPFQQELERLTPTQENLEATANRIFLRAAWRVQW